MAKNIDISLTIEAASLGKDLEKVGEDVANEINQQIANTAQAAYASIIAKAQQDLNATRGDYLKDLKFDQIGGDYVISLEGDFSSRIEEGFSAYDLKNILLKSTKTVKVGSRSGMPWVKKSKAGNRYASVPFSHKPFSKAGGASDLSSLIQKMKTKNARGRTQKLTSIFKDISGSPLEGRVAVMKKTSVADLEGLVKYQKNYKNQQTGKLTTQSLYMTYRTISDKSSGWKHPGWRGLHAFEDAEKFVKNEIRKILEDFIK